MRIPSFRRAGPSSWHPRGWTRPRPGVLGARTAAVTFGVLEALSLREPLRALLGPEGSRGLALAALGGATLRLLKSRGGRGRWGLRPKPTREPVEAALAVAVLGVLALPLVLGPTSARPGQAPSRRHEATGGPARSEADDGGDGDGLDFNGAIASW